MKFLRRPAILRRSAWTKKVPNLVLSYRVRGKSWNLENNGGYQNRNASTSHLVTMAMENVKGQFTRSFTIPIWTDDFVETPKTSVHFAYCNDVEQTSTIAIPDHLFWAWPEVGIHDYDEVSRQIVEASRKPPEDPHLFWVGNPDTHPSRHQLIAASQFDRRILANGIQWLHHERSAERLPTAGQQFVSLPDHCRYRYLIDLQGRGYSGRLKLLLFSGRPLFVQERRWREYFFDKIKPYQHYIPVREDLSDLSSQLDWAETHETEAAAIARNAQQFAQSYLTRRGAVDALEKSILHVAEGTSLRQ